MPLDNPDKSVWFNEDACHTEIRAAGEALVIQPIPKLTAADAKWIASGLADPMVRVGH